MSDWGGDRAAPDAPVSPAPTYWDSAQDGRGRIDLSVRNSAYARQGGFMKTREDKNKALLKIAALEIFGNVLYRTEPFDRDINFDPPAPKAAIFKYCIAMLDMIDTSVLDPAAAEIIDQAINMCADGAVEAGEAPLGDAIRITMIRCLVADAEKAVRG